jgi:hypothetical protein
MNVIQCKLRCTTQSVKYYSYNKSIFVIIRQVVYRSLNATVAQPKNCPYEANTTIELKII